MLNETGSTRVKRPPTPERILANLRRRLAAAELEHLRQVVGEQAARIEDLEAQVERLGRESDCMQARAELWEDNYFAAAEEVRAAGLAPCLTQGGFIHLARAA